MSDNKDDDDKDTIKAKYYDENYKLYEQVKSKFSQHEDCTYVSLVIGSDSCIPSSEDTWIEYHNKQLNFVPKLCSRVKCSNNEIENSKCKKELYGSHVHVYGPKKHSNCYKFYVFGQLIALCQDCREESGIFRIKNKSRILVLDDSDWKIANDSLDDLINNVSNLSVK